MKTNKLYLILLWTFSIGISFVSVQGSIKPCILLYDTSNNAQSSKNIFRIRSIEVTNKKQEVNLNYKNSMDTFSTYYIGVDGNDSNDGTFKFPFATLKKALSLVKGGDTILFKAGTYYPDSQIYITRSGLLNLPIVIISYNDSAVLDFSNSKLIPTGNNPPYPVDMGAITVKDAKNVVIQKIKVINAKSAGIQSRNSMHVVITGCSTYNTASSGVSAWGSDSVLISNNHIRLACNMGPHECISISNTSHFVVENNEISETTAASSVNGGEGIDVKEGCNSGIVRGNYVHNLYRQGLYVDSWNNHIDSIAIYNNRVHDCNYGFAISTEQPGGTINRVYFHHNVIYNSFRSGIIITLWGESGHEDHLKRNIFIYNNTVYQNGWKRAAENPGYPCGGMIIEPKNIQNVVIRNNIFSNNCSFCFATMGGVDDSITLDYNIFDGPNSKPFRKTLFSTFTSETSGLIPFNPAIVITGYPAFVDTTNYNFHLTSHSPAINAGNPDTIYNDPDKSRNDIGAFYYIPSDTVTSIPDIKYSDDITIYPNPVFDGWFNVTHADLNNSHITLYDLTGRAFIIKNQISENDMIDVSCLNDGIYFLKIVTQKSVYTKRIYIRNR